MVFERFRTIMRKQQQRTYLLAQQMEDVPFLPSAGVLVKWESVTQNPGGRVRFHCTEVCLYKIMVYSLS